MCKQATQNVKIFGNFEEIIQKYMKKSLCEYKNKTKVKN